jgi:ribonuclease BN (tRNA processing enzyme)
MNFKVLGCGPILQKDIVKNCSGYLIDEHILFDCGPGIWRALNEQGINAHHLHYIVISHYHIDHIADITAFLMARYLMLDQIEQPLLLTGPAGIKDWFDHVKRFCGTWAERVPVRLQEARAEQKLAGYGLKSALTGHSENSLCYRLENSDGNTFFYSGDSDECQAIGLLAADSDLAVIESSNTEATKVKGHLTPGRAAKIAAEANVKKLVLTHMYPEVSHEYALSEANKYFSGEIIIARDGLILNINAE